MLNGEDESEDSDEGEAYGSEVSEDSDDLW